MSQTRNKRRNNVLAGVFVTISLALGVGVIGTLMDAWGNFFLTTSTYHVSFPIESGVGKLASGSAVRLGGVLIGSVAWVEPRIRRGDDAPISLIDVEFDIDDRFVIYDNVTIHVKAGLLGSTSWLAITDVGNGKIAIRSTKIHGKEESMVSQFLGSEAESNLKKSLHSLRVISEAFAKEGGALDVLFGNEEAQQLREAITSARDGLVAVDSIMQSTQTVWPAWQDSVTSILEDSSEIPNQLNETLLQVQGAVRDIRTNVLPNVERSVISFKESMKVLETISNKYLKSEPKWALMIEGILSNVDQMSSTAKDAIDDISASPWRLLYRPTDREIAYEQLHAASWQLLNALSDLRRTAEALQAASLSPDAPAEAASLAQSLARNEAAFEQAREAILERMKLDFPQR